MNDMVDIDIVIDENYVEPKVTILTKTKSQQVENIVYAIENASRNEFPFIPAYQGKKLELISQRDIIRTRTNGRLVILETENEKYTVKKTLTQMESILNNKRFIRISQSEIINLYKVKRFDITAAGTVGVEFNNGEHSWVSRRCVKAIKNLLREGK